MVQSPSDSGTSYPGFQQLSDAASEFNVMHFIIKQMIEKRVLTSVVVQVNACTNNGGLTLAGTVDVTPMVNQVDPDGNPVPHAKVFGIPYSRWQGGSNAVIMDPFIGDIGVMLISSHDISVVKKNKSQSNPGSKRRFSMSDGVYLGGILNGVPTQYVQFNSQGITLVSPVNVSIAAPNIDLVASEQIVLQAPGIVLNGEISQTAGGDGSGTGVSLQGPVTVVNDVVAGGKSLINHTHLEHGVGNQTSPPT